MCKWPYYANERPEFVSKVTDAIIEDVQEWQNRPLDPFYAIVYFDAIVIKTHHEGCVTNKAVNTINAIESLNFALRLITKNRAAFSTDDAAMILLYLALTNASKKWTR